MLYFAYMFRWLFGKKEEKLDMKEIDALCGLAEDANQRRYIQYQVENSKTVKVGKDFKFGKN